MISAFIKSFLRRLRRMWGACGAHVGRMCARALVRVVGEIVRPLDDDLTGFIIGRKGEKENERQ